MKYRVELRLFDFENQVGQRTVHVVDGATFDGGWLVLGWGTPGRGGRTRQMRGYPSGAAQYVQIDEVADDYVEREVAEPEMRIDEPGTMYALGSNMWTTLGDTGVEIMHDTGRNIGIRWRRTNKWTIPAGSPVHAALIGLVATAAQGSTQPGRDKMTTLGELWPELASAIDQVIGALGGND